MLSVQTAVKQHPKELVATMLSADFGSVFYTAKKDCGIPSDERAEELMVAFCQWFAVIPTLQPGDWHAVLESPVDNIFHAMILNTEVYEAFCNTHLGEFVHHTPIDGTREDLPLAQFVSDTLIRLETTYGADLAPDLKAWRGMFDSGNWQVSCVKHCPNMPTRHTVVGQVLGVNLLH